MPFSMGNISVDDAQAQRNLDPLYLSSKHDEEWVVERTLAVANKLGPDRMLRVEPQLQGGRGIKAEMRDVPEGGRIMIKPGDERAMTVRFQVQKGTPGDVVQRFPIAFKDGERVVGGVTFTIQIANGRIEGRAHGLHGPATSGRVTLDHIKLKGVKVEAPIQLDGRFSFVDICPGPTGSPR